MDLTASWPSEFEFSNVSDIEYMVSTLMKDGFHDFFFYRVNPGRKLRLIAHSYAYDTHQRTQTMLWLVKYTPLSVKLYPAKENTTYVRMYQKINEEELQLDNDVCQLCMPSDQYLRRAIQAFSEYVQSIFFSTDSSIYAVLIDLVIDYVPLYSMYKIMERALPLNQRPL